MLILGISCWYHDSAAALLEDGEIITAVQEERFTRKKHDPSFPRHAILYCLREANISIDDVDAIVYYEDSALKFKRIRQTWKDFFPKSVGIIKKTLFPWLFKKRFTVSSLVKAFEQIGLSIHRDRVFFNEHHMSHAASAFYPSPFLQAAVLVIDGVGEFSTASIWKGEGESLEKLVEVKFPHSIGLLYSTLTAYLGFKVNSGEYKVMGLAPYGQAIYKDKLTQLIQASGSLEKFQLNLKYFSYPYSGIMYTSELENLLGHPARAAESQLTQFHMDVAASLQVLVEELVYSFAQKALEMTGFSNLCFAGGVALNCVANGKILSSLALDGKFWIQPASGDAGNALGAAMCHFHRTLGNPRVVRSPDSMQGAYLGPSSSQSEIDHLIKSHNAQSKQLSDQELYACVAEYLGAGKVVGWHQGRAEFGPRSLGNRSILGDPRNPDMQKTMNLKIKYRESFRPFAPAVLAEDCQAYFELTDVSPYMLLVASVKNEIRKDVGSSDAFGIDRLNEIRSDIPAVTHIDYSARIQTVSMESNPRFYALLQAFKQQTGCSVLINTSFNVRGEPIVLNPEDSYRCFMRTNMDVLVINNNVFLKADQPQSYNDTDWQEEFVLD